LRSSLLLCPWQYFVRYSTPTILVVTTLVAGLSSRMLHACWKARTKQKHNRCWW
jgi:hypothetical protein